jgi:hypothetical protein
MESLKRQSASKIVSSSPKASWKIKLLSVFLTVIKLELFL